MSAILILVIALVCLALGYIFYGSWLAKKWGVDPNRETPAHTNYDGKDYVPAHPAVLMGHHFSSIAGAGPINGPIQAAVFGWLPVLLWVVIGGIFFGAMHDFGALFASIRHGGLSIAEVIRDSMGSKAQKLFMIFALLVLILVIASFTSVVASTFVSDYSAAKIDAFQDGVTYFTKSDSGAYQAVASGTAFDATAKYFVHNSFFTTGTVAANASTAMTSLLFIVIAFIFGFFVYRKNAKVGPATIIGIIGIVLIVWLGLKVGINMWLLQDNGSIDQLTNLDGFYSGTRFVVAKPINPSGSQVLGYVFVSCDTTSIVGAYRSFIWVGISVLAAVMMIALLVTLAYSKKMAEPLDEMAVASRKFAHGDFSVRVDNKDKRTDEVGALIDSFNEMADSLENSEARRREFIGNISHELRTPMRHGMRR